MNEPFFQILSIGSPIIIGLIGFIIRHIQQRLDLIEKKLDKTMTKEEVRQTVDDKVYPIREDLTEIKDAIRQLFLLYLKDRDGT